MAAKSVATFPPCPICGLRKRHTDEDVFPIWARRALWDHLPRDGTWVLPPRVKIRVCSDCNAQMGRLYEDPTAPLLKPIIMGSDVTGLSRRHQALIGRWCIKTVMLAHFKQAMSLGKVHEDDRLALLRMNEGGPPPEGSSVRLAKYVDHGPRNPPGVPLRGSLEGAKQLASSTYGVVGHLAMEVISGTSSASLDFLSRTQDDERFVRVWPPSVKSVDLLPGAVVSESDLDVIRGQLSVLTPGTRFRISREATERPNAGKK